MAVAVTSLLVSVGAYALIWGWKFAIGFVVLLFIHEMGHVIALRREEPRTALKDFQAAYYLDPQSPTSWSDLIEATRAVKADGG